MTTGEFSIEYFIEEAHRFHEMISSSSMWENTEKKTNNRFDLIGGLTTVYLNVKTSSDEQEKYVDNIYKVCLNDFNHRTRFYIFK